MQDKVSGLGKKNEVAVYLKNKAKYLFLEQFLSTITKCQERGIYLTVKGKNGSRIIKKFVPFLFGFAVDTAEAYKLTGTRPGVRKCRLCESIPSNFHDNSVLSIRHSKEYVIYQRDGEKAWINKIFNLPQSEYYENLLIHNKKFSIQNISNPLHDHFLSNGRNLFQAVAYDMMHTLLKGLLQQIFMWTLVVISLCAKKRYNGLLMFEKSLEILDRRMKFFPLKQSIFPCEPHMFIQGVSPYIAGAKRSMSGASQAVMNATKLEAQKYLSILFQLMLSIGK